MDAVIEHWSRPDALVNNAGWGWLRALAETDDELPRTTFDINFFSAANLITRAWPTLVKQGSGCVVNVSSGAAHEPCPGFFAYAASKAAMESLGRSVASEGRELGIRAYSVALGAVETPLLRAAFSEEVIPREKTLDPHDVATRIRDCVLGRAPVANGGTVVMPSPV